MNPSESQFDSMGTALGYKSGNLSNGAKVTWGNNQQVIPGQGHVKTGVLTGEYAPFVAGGPATNEGVSGILGTPASRQNENS